MIPRTTGYPVVNVTSTWRKESQLGTRRKDRQQTFCHSHPTICKFANIYPKGRQGKQNFSDDYAEIILAHTISLCIYLSDGEDKHAYVMFSLLHETNGRGKPFAGWSHILSGLHATKNNFLMCSYIISTFIQKQCLRATTWGSAVQETLFWLSTGIRHDYLVVSILTSADPCKRWPATSVGM